MESEHTSIDDARKLLAEVDDIRTDTRRELNAHGWQWYLVWAVVCLGAAISGFTEIAGWYWAFALPIAIAATVYVAMTFERDSGVQRSAGPYWVVGTAIGVLNFSASMLLSDEAVVVVVWVVFGLGFAAFAWLERHRYIPQVFATVSVAVAIAGTLVPDTFDLYIIVGFVFAAVMVGVAAGIRALGNAA